MRAWWSARKTWQKVTIVVLAIIVIAGIAGGDEAVEDGDPIALQTTTTEATTTTTITETTTTQPITTTTQPTTTPTLSVADRIEIYVIVFEGQRAAIAQIIEEGLFHIDSVDVLRYESEDDEATLYMSATSGFPSLLPEDLPDDGWDIMQLWKEYWGGVVQDDANNEILVPAFVIDLSGHTFECPAQFMIDMIDLRVSQSDFVETCIDA